jgi:nucleotide-binding universal stress UspA family protein
MLKRILIAVDDSAPALAAAELAIELGRDPSTELHFVTVTEAGRTTDAILRHVAALAARAGISATFTDIPDGGNPFERLLAAAHDWGADLMMMGRSDKRRPGEPYVGSQTEHLLEFTDIPVLVVPCRKSAAASIGGGQNESRG